MKTATVKSKPAAGNTSPPAVDHGQRRQRIVDELLAEIVQGKLRAGERLRIQTLANRFGVSQSPIREALVTLEGIGIVDIEANRGAIVRKISLAEVREISQVRLALECAAVKRACGRADHSRLQSLIESFEKMASRQISERDLKSNSARLQKAIQSARELDSEFHDLIAAWSGNRFLERELSRLKLLFRAFRDNAWGQTHSAREVTRITEEAREHLEIAQAILSGNSREAARTMSRHIRNGVKYWAHGLPE
ncbi:MAG: GntR family transcriptional regulator [Planctomycetaceae bacterium]|nr:GntR family transcriptional regulator [Planctomycetaceae bacterium]